MNSLKKIIPLLILVVLSITGVKAQIDTAFWFAAPWVTPDHDDRDPIFFHFSTFSNATTIRIQQPASTYDTTFVVPANALFSKGVDFMMDSIESKPANQILRTGFKITSDYPITIVYDVVTRPPASNNPETYSLKGSNGMGKEFVLPFQTLWNNKFLTNDRDGDGVITQPYQQFNVVAAEDNTTIYITPSCDIIGHPANITFSIVLPLKGNVYTGQNLTQITNVLGSNLAGTIVVADKDISITVSDDSVNPTAGGGCYDLMGDQIVPTDVIGNEYIVNKGFLNAGSNESVFIVATENFTSLSIDNGLTVSSAIINQGETYPYSLTENLTYVNSDKPVYLYHMSGYGCEMGEAILPPLNCSGSDQVSFSRANAKSFLLNILCPAGAEGNFVLNGSTTLVTAANFNPVPGTGGQWVGTQISFNTTDVTVGSANLITNSTALFSLGIINGSAAGGALYHYVSSFNRKVFVEAGKDTTLCDNEPVVNLNGSVTGGSTTGIWSVINGTGTLTNPLSLVTTYLPTTNDYNQGFATLVLSSTGNCDPILDTLTISFINSPEVIATSDSSLCKNNSSLINLSGSLAFAVGSVWSGGVGGSFGNASDLNTTYIPSPADISSDSVILYLTSVGSLNSCPNDEDTLIIYFTPSPSVVPGADIIVCSSTDSINLAGLIAGPTNSGLWTSTGSGLFSPSADSLNTTYFISSADTAVGSLVFTLTTTNNGNCNSEQDSLQLTILDKPNVTITNADSICSNVLTATLSGSISAGFSSLWTVIGAGNVVTPSSLNTIYNISPIDIAAGYIDVLLISDPTFCQSEQDSMRIYFITPPVASAGIDTSFCENEVVQLQGTIIGPNQVGSWQSTGTGSFFPSNNLLTAFYTPSALDILNGSVELILTSIADFGCMPDSDTLTITFDPKPTANFSSVDVCQAQLANFTDLSSATTGTINSWNWNFGDLTTSITQNPQHIYNTNGTLQVTLIAGSTNGCLDTIQHNIKINPLPVVDFTYGISCENMPIDFYDNSFISSGNNINWVYTFNAGDSVVSQNATHTYNSSGNYNVSFQVTSNLGCTNTITKVVAVIPGPTAVFQVSPNPALALETVDFTDLSNGNPTLWHWDFGDETGDNSQNTVNSYANGGSYIITLTITDANGCSDDASQTLEIALLPILPTAFTPNGDKENDVFLIRGGPFKSSKLKIYNSWGELIFQSNDAAIGWGGKYKGEPSPLGVYTWIFEVEMIGGKLIKKSGDVTLLR